MFDDFSISEIIHVPQKYKRTHETVPKEEEVKVNMCPTCSLEFQSADEMREHHKSDLHLQNLLNNLNASDSEDELDEIIVVDKDQLLICKSKDDTVVGIFPQLLNSDAWDYLNVQSLNSYFKKLNNQKWGFMMLSGGDFAGAVIDVATGKAIVHKSIHRYTTRRKQGGGQSSHDQSKGKASSAGSNIRRYNEQALVQDIISFLSTNKEFKNINLMWLYGAKKNELNLKSCLETANIDVESRKVPISVGKPTYSSLMTCFQNLTTLQNASFEKITLMKSPLEDAAEIEQDIEIKEDIAEESTDAPKKKKKKKKKKAIISDDVVDMRVPLPETPTAREHYTKKLSKPVDRIPDRQKMLEAVLNRTNNGLTCPCGKGIDIKNSFEKANVKYCSINCLRTYS